MENKTINLDVVNPFLGTELEQEYLFWFTKMLADLDCPISQELVNELEKTFVVKQKILQLQFKKVWLEFKNSFKK